MKNQLTTKFNDEDLKSTKKEEDEFEIFYDDIAARYFKGNVEQLKWAIDLLNKDLLDFPDLFISLNTFYKLIGEPIIKMGDLFGWSHKKLIDFEILVFGDVKVFHLNLISKYESLRT